MLSYVTTDVMMNDDYTAFTLPV